MVDFILLQVLINWFLFIFGGIVIFLFMNKIFKSIKRFKCIQNFVIYQKLLEYHMEKAYAIIHKDNLLIYSIEAIKINDDEFADVTKNYGGLVIKMLGPMLYEELIFLYGSEDTLLFTIVEYFNDKYESDEIRETAIENLQHSGDE